VIDAAVALVWIAPEPADAEQSRALSSWSRARGIRLSLPSNERLPALTIDAAVATDLESLLEQARDAVAARDRKAADAALSSAESMLRAHPELPQAAWLMAQVERARATCLRRVSPTDADGAVSAWLRAEALDGGRVPGAEEEGSARHPLAATLTLDVTPQDTQAWLDAEPVSAGAIATRAGLHVLVLTWHGAPIWASWIVAPAGNSAVSAAATPVPACSTEDVSRARLGADGIDARHVQCRVWVAALPGLQRGSVRIAICEGDRCGPLFEWQAPLPWTWSPPAKPGNDGKWPAWASWGLAGAGAAIATSAVVLAAGALQSAPVETRFVIGGIKAH
jgi:hypothetical protein